MVVASIDDVQSTEPPRKRLRRLRHVESDEQMMPIPLADAQSASLPMSKGAKKSMHERYADLSVVIREWNQWHEQERAIDNDVNFDNVRHTFDQILKRRRSEFERAGARNALLPVLGGVPTLTAFSSASGARCGPMSLAGRAA